MIHAEEEIRVFLEQLKALFAADGANMRIVAATSKRIHVRIEFTEETCRDCVMPPDTIREIIEGNLKTQLCENAEIRIEWDD
ncbi:MAG: NifU family protein [Clostridiales Family XIII bacterium]|jgi:Fe-S cluster biogenesis protein NfuA|nr:NifU family protein [Clostridiales Family XIII bacterium]